MENEVFIELLVSLSQFAESAAKLLLFAGLHKYCLKKHRKRMFCLHVQRNFPIFATLKNSIETQSFRIDNDQ